MANLSVPCALGDVSRLYFVLRVPSVGATFVHLLFCSLHLRCRNLQSGALPLFI